jgi:hypothetical protein
MINATTAPIAEQILDIAEAASHLTILAEIDFEREENRADAHEGDGYFEYMMDKRFKE